MIRKSYVLRYLNIVYDELIKLYSYLHVDNFVFNPDKSLGDCSTVNDAYGIHCVEIGIKELEDDSKEYVSDFDFMKSFVGMFHEVCGHCELIKNHFQKDDDLSSIIALNHYACKSSSVYYYGKYYNNYFYQPHEIAAQYLGIENCYKFSKNFFGEEKAEQLICDYVNERIRLNSEFIKFKNGKPYESIQSILSAFDDAFNKSIHRHKEFDVKLALRESSPFFYYHNHSDSINSRLVSLRRDGNIQDAMMSLIYLHEEDPNDYLRNRVPIFKNGNLYTEKIFGFGNDLKKRFRGKRFYLDQLHVSDDQKSDIENTF